jgi:hypothetical protein
MEFEDTSTIDADREVVWELISDPEVLYSCVPGAEEINKESDTEYTGVISRGIAGISIELDGELNILTEEPPERLEAEASGSDRITNSRLDAEAELRVNQGDDGTADLVYSIEMVFSGRLATLGSRIVKRQIKSDVDTFFENLKEQANERSVSNV